MLREGQPWFSTLTQFILKMFISVVYNGMLKDMHFLQFYKRKLLKFACFLSQRMFLLQRIVSLVETASCINLPGQLKLFLNN